MPPARPKVVAPPMPPAQPKVVSYDVEGTVIVPVATAGLRIQDFGVESRIPSIDWEVVRVSRVASIEQDSVPEHPLSALLLFDQSGSIEKTDPANARIPAAQSLASQLPGGTRIAMAHFPHFAFGMQAPVGGDLPFTTDTRTVVQRIGRIGKPNGPTPLLTALLYAIRQLSAEADSRKRVLVCLSDGQPQGDPSSLSPVQVTAAAVAAGVRIHFVALGHEDWDLQRRIARATGGTVVAAENAARLEDAFREIGRQVNRVEKHHYVVTVRARRFGSPFAKGESLEGEVVHPRGSRRFEITVP